MLGLGTKLTKSKIVTPGIVTDNLVMKHMYPAGAVQPLSDGAAYFDGSTDHIQLASAISHNTISIATWINVTDDATTKVILDTRDGDNDGILFWVSDAEVLYLYVNGSDSGSSASQLTSGVWTHVVGTYDGTNLKLYINGVLVLTQADAGSSETVSTTTAARIGKVAYSNSSWFKGYMCNMGIWSRAITQAEIKSIMWKQYADLTTTEKTSLVSFWNLDSTVASGLSLVYDENNTTLGSDLWSITDPIGPDTLGGADGDKNASMDLSDVGLAAGDVIKISGTISGSNGGQIICPDTGGESNGVTLVTGSVDQYQREDGDFEVYVYVSDVTGVLKIRTDHDYGGANDITQQLSNIKVQKITNAGRLV